MVVMTMLSQFSLNNGYEVETKIFSGGEVQVTLKPMFNAKSSGANVICLLAHLKCANGIIALAQIKQILNRDFPDSKIYLIMPYVPYARQDRAMVKGDAFSLKVFANLLNSLKFDCVEITDPHSDVTPALIDNVNVVEQHKCYWIKITRNNLCLLDHMVLVVKGGLIIGHTKVQII